MNYVHEAAIFQDQFANIGPQDQPQLMRFFDAPSNKILSGNNTGKVIHTDPMVGVSEILQLSLSLIQY